MPKVVPNSNKYVKKYTEQDIQNALEAVKNGMPKKTASRKFNVPRATIQFRLSESFVKSKPGPCTVLTEAEETTLVEWICTSSRKGFPKRKEDIVENVKFFLKTNPRPNSFIDNTPGEGWYKLFLKRHPEITKRTSEAVTSASAVVSEENVRGWFNQIENYLKDNEIFDILSDPSRVLNGDETNFQLCPKNSQVLAPRGSRNVYEVEHAPGKTSLTVMFSFQANGETTPPMVIFPLKRMQNSIQKSIPLEWGIALSDSGWMRGDIFIEYIKNILHPHLCKKNVQFPVILFVDGHKSHTTYELSELCKNLGIILIALYPNATRILQPADVAAFKPIKSAWKRAVIDWRRNNLNKILTKTDFGPILKIVLENHINRNIIRNGFRACGLFPWNPSAIDYSKCLGTSSLPKEVLKPIEPTLNFEEFKVIVGEDKLNELENPTMTIRSSEHQALMKIYEKLKPHSSNCVSNNKENVDSIVLNDMWYPIDDVPFTLEKPLEIISPNIENRVEIECLDPPQAENKAESTPKKNVLLQDTLVWPKTPIRKGKMVEKRPFVLTSKDWMIAEEVKITKKTSIEKEKLEKKRKREEKKRKAENKISEKKCKKNSNTKKKNENLPSTSKDIPVSTNENINNVEEEKCTEETIQSPSIPAGKNNYLLKFLDESDIENLLK